MRRRGLLPDGSWRWEARVLAFTGAGFRKRR
jgi:hypothetical protein